MIDRSQVVYMNIQITQGGFILEYPEIRTENEKEAIVHCTTVFTSQGKLQRKVKEVLESFKLVTEE